MDKKEQAKIKYDKTHNKPMIKQSKNESKWK